LRIDAGDTQASYPSPAHRHNSLEMSWRRRGIVAHVGQDFSLDRFR
jgi:hypothetical protein